MLRALVLAGLLTGCAGLDEPDRVLISDSATTVTNRATTEVYVDLLDFATATHLSGTPEAFTVGGTVTNPWNATTGTVTGSGGKVGDALDVHLDITVAGWDDELWNTQLTGTVSIDQHATFAGHDLPLGDGSDTITAHLQMTGSLAGTHDVSIVACRKLVANDPLYGYHGLVDGEPVSDHYEGNDPLCNVTSP